MIERVFTQLKANGLRTLGGVLLMLSVAANSQQVFQPAQLAEDAEAPEIRRYSVELIIFEYNAGDNSSSELFLPDELPALELMPAETDELEGELIAPDDIIGIEQAAAIDAKEIIDPADVEERPFTAEELVLNEIPGLHEIGFEILDPSDYSLDEVYEKLVQIGRARPMKSRRASMVALAEFEAVHDGTVHKGYLLISTENVGGKPMVASMQLRW